MTQEPELKPTPDNPISQAIDEMLSDIESELTNRLNGDDYGKYIVQVYFEQKRRGIEKNDRNAS